MAWHKAVRKETRVTIGDFQGDFEAGQHYDLPDDVAEALVADGTVVPSDGPEEETAATVQEIADQAAAQIADVGGSPDVVVTVEEAPPEPAPA